MRRPSFGGGPRVRTPPAPPLSLSFEEIPGAGRSPALPLFSVSSLSGGNPMSVATDSPVIPPVSVLSDSERELAEGVYDFALETIGPRSGEMDRANVMDPDLIRKFFDLDLMGIEIPEEFGGLGANFTTSIAIIEALARVDAACAVRSGKDTAALQ